MFIDSITYTHNDIVENNKANRIKPLYFARQLDIAFL